MTLQQQSMFAFGTLSTPRVSLPRPTTALLCAMLLSSTACRDLVGNAVLPPGTQSPNAYNTPGGAVGAYQGAKIRLQSAIANASLETGALTDELSAAGLGSGPLSIGATGDPIDERLLPESQTTAGDIAGNNAYGSLQSLRGSTLEAIGLLRTYAPDSLALRGEMYALQGYAELLLAEVYCSGVPLSTLDFQQDFTYKPSSTQTEVYQHALALLDSALAISSDSASVMWLASVAKGRLLLDLGQYAQAAQAVATVPDTFQYSSTFTWAGGGTPAFLGFSVSNQEGLNGLPFSSSGDPRSAVTAAGFNASSVPLFRPTKYPFNAPSSVILASGVEARLIQAEVAVRNGDPTWLAILNTLRTDGTVARTYTRLCLRGIRASDGTVLQQGSPCPAGVVDTTWGPGTGITLIPAIVLADTAPVCPTSGAGRICTDTVWYKGLRLLSDPGTDSERMALVFHERAYWFFLTGHRQGDLRRLVRNYGYPQESVYPTGPYYGGHGVYGTDVTLPIPATERPNPLFHGCLNRRA